METEHRPKNFPKKKSKMKIPDPIYLRKVVQTVTAVLAAHGGGRRANALGGAHATAISHVGVALGGGAILVDLETVDAPVGLLESSGVVADVVIAAAVESGADGVCAPDLAGPLATEGDIEDLARL